MTSRSKVSRKGSGPRRAGPGSTGPATSSATWLLPAVVGAVIVVVAILAVVLSGGAGGGPSTAPSSPASSATASSPAATASTGGASPSSTATTISGTPLPRYAPGATDPAKGLLAPVINAMTESGDPVTTAPAGKPKLIIVAAHWCPHCQREIPLIQQWIDAGQAPSDVDFVTVSTAIDPNGPNYPPAAWFASVHWTAPVIEDVDGTVATALGVSSYPFFVLLDPTGHVVARVTGEMPIADLASLLASAPR